MQDLVQPELTLSAKNNAINRTIPSHLKNYRLTPTSGNPSTFTTSSQTTVFEIPGNTVFNASKMSLNFKRGAIGAFGTGYNAVPCSYFPYIERIELKSSNGTILVDVNSIAQYSRLSMPLLNNFRENTQLSGALYPTKSIALEAQGTELHGYDPYFDNKITKSAFPGEKSCNAETLLRYANYDWSKINSALPEKNINISLSDLLPDTLFGINKEIYNARNLYLRIQWAPYTSWLYRITETGISMSNDSAGTIDFLNLNLNMYVEANQDLAQMIQKQYETQQILICPELQCQNINISNSEGDRSAIIKVLNSGNARLYKFYSGLVSGNTSNFYLINNTSNYNNLKYSNVELYLNTLQLLNLNTEYNQDLEHMLQFYKNHSFSDSSSFKVVSPFSHVFDSSIVEDKLYDGKTLRGIEFDNPQGEHSLQIKYKLKAPTADCPVNPNNQSSFIMYVFCVLNKPIYIKGGDFQLIPFV